MIVVQNDDVRVGFELFGEDINAPYDNPLDASSLYDYNVYVYRDLKCKELLAIYKKANSGMFSIQVDGTQSNLIWIVISREILRYVTGKILAEVKIQATASSPFINNKANAGVTDIDLFTLLKSASPTALP